MYVKTLIASLLIAASCYGAEPAVVETNRVMQLLAVAKEISATDGQVSKAIASGATVEEFTVQILGKVQIIGPEQAPVHSPVQITVKGLPQKCTELWKPVEKDAVWLKLFDREGQPVNIFWSAKPGLKHFELIVAENGPEVPTLEIATYNLDYVGSVPIPDNEPTPALKAKVAPLKRFALSQSDRANLVEFYTDFAEVVDGCKTSQVFRNAYINAGNAMFSKTGIKGKYAGLGETIDGILSDHIGLDVGPLDAGKAKEILLAVAWGLK